MHRQNSNKLFRLLYSSLQALSKAISNLLKLAVGELIIEIALAVSIIGFSSLFMSWGLALPWALITAICTTLGLLILPAYLFFELNYRGKQRGEIALAKWISHSLTDKNVEWHDYQDWLHDILLARQQLLDAKCPPWRVKLITYRRLSVFCLVVGVSKMKQVALKNGRPR